MDRERRKRVLGLFALLASIVVAASAAVAAADTLRWVELVSLLGGGFGAGAATVRLFLPDGRRQAP